MAEVTRFMVLRPPTLVDPANDTVPVRPRPNIMTALQRAIASSQPGRALAIAAASERAKLTPPTALPLFAALSTWARSVLSATNDDAQSALHTAQQAFARPAADVVASAEFTRTRDALVDWVACDKYRGFADELAEPTQRALRAAFLLERLAQDAATVGSPRAVLRRPLLLDMPRPVRAPTVRTPPAAKPADELTAITEQIADHRAVLDALTTAPSRLLSNPSQSAAGARRPVVSQALAAAMTPAARDVMTANGVQIGEDSLSVAHSQVVKRLRELYRREQQLSDARQSATTYAMRIGNGVFEVGSSLGPLLDALDHDMTALPTTHATLPSVGIADLMVVRQQLLRYEAADLSFVENVLIGEHKSREHKTQLISERTETSETETTREEERDLQTTDRNELQREASSTLQDSLSLQFGTKLSGSYGPTVQFAVNTDLGFDHVKEESNKFASTVAKETMQRAASKITERFKQQSIIKLTNTTEEINIHEVDNKGRDQHVVGMYQWLDKVYEAQVFNYGLRVLYDIVVPEPAALAIQLAKQPGPGTLIKKPPTFALNAATIDEANYTELATKYGATTIEAPPEPIQTVSKVLEGMDENQERGVTHQTADLPIPSGYEALSAAIATDFWQANIDEGPAQVLVLIAGERAGFNDNKREATINLSGEQGTLAVAMHSFHTPSVVVTIAVQCRRTPRAMEEWRLGVYAALKQASDQQQREYEEKVARAKSEAAAATATTPQRRTESEIRNELKRLAIAMFTRQSFETFDAVDDGTLPAVAFDAAEIQDPYIRFFEHAFEWEHMMYVFYPYFWGRTQLWKTRVLFADPDPSFTDFVKSGAARLVIPVRRNFENAVSHFFETGQVWSGGPVPEVTSPDYVSVITELKERSDAPDEEIAVGQPWEVRLPTQLVKLRTSTSLPSWQKQADGTFTPVGD